MQEWFPIQHALFSLPTSLKEETVAALAHKLTPGKIPLSCTFHENGTFLRLAAKKKIALDNETVASIEKLGVKVQIAL